MKDNVKAIFVEYMAALTAAHREEPGWQAAWSASLAKQRQFSKKDAKEFDRLMRARNSHYTA